MSENDTESNITYWRPEDIMAANEYFKANGYKVLTPEETIHFFFLNLVDFQKDIKKLKAENIRLEEEIKRLQKMVIHLNEIRDK